MEGGLIRKSFRRLGEWFGSGRTGDSALLYEIGVHGFDCGGVDDIFIVKLLSGAIASRANDRGDSLIAKDWLPGEANIDGHAPPVTGRVMLMMAVTGLIWSPTRMSVT